MNFKQIVEELKEKFPNKKIIPNDNSHPTEIICEVEPSSDHPEYSKAMAIIDQSIKHFHKNATEEYIVIKGNLVLTVDGEDHDIAEGQSYIIYHLQHHSAKGDSTWVECISTPGWQFEDHIVVK